MSASQVRLSPTCAVCAMVVLLLTASPGAADLPDDPAERTYHAIPIESTQGLLPIELNDLGQVAGMMSLPPPSATVGPFFWSPCTGTIDLLPTIPNESGMVEGLNNLGHVLINADADSYLWKGGATAVNLGYLPGDKKLTNAYGLNDLDQVVGAAYTVLRYSPTPKAIAFLWEEGKGFKLLGDLPGGNFDSSGRAINNNQVVVGGSISSCGVEAFVWSEETGMKNLGKQPNGKCIQGANDVNDAGQIVGGANGPQTYYAYMLDPATGFHVLGELPGPLPCTNALEINEFGLAIGVGYTTCQVQETRYVFLWDETYGFRSFTAKLKLDAVSAKADTIEPQPFLNNRGQFLARRWPLPTKHYRLDPILLGDINCDGVVNTDDLQPFLGQMLKYMGTTPPLFDGEECGWWIGDINQDALLDENDLAPFLALVFPKADVNQK